MLTSTRVGVLGILCALLVLVSSSCGRPYATGGPTISQDTATQRALLTALRAIVPPEVGEPTIASVEFLRDSSAMVPGLAYTWVVYRPPGSEHARWLQVAARRFGESRIVTTPSEWMKAASPQWPRNSNAFVQICGELLRAVGPRRDPIFQPKVFVDRASLQDLDAPLADSALKVVAPPLTDKRDTRWVATLWAIEFGRIAKYRCQLSKADSAGLVEMDSVTNLGPRYRP